MTLIGWVGAYSILSYIGGLVIGRFLAHGLGEAPVADASEAAG